VNDYEAPPPSLVLTRSGHFEFWVPSFAWVCFQQNQEQFQAQPRLWPIAVVEFPLNFLLFVKELYRRIGVTGAITARVEYQHLGGCILYPGGPEGGLWHSRLFTFSEQHYGPYERQLAVDFDPEATALAFALHFYRSVRLRPDAYSLLPERQIYAAHVLMWTRPIRSMTYCPCFGF
jgi:hypothetical protein